MLDWQRLIRVILFATPVAYASILIAVLVHEVGGHGLAALLLGGSFYGFAVDLMGMGWAYTELPSEAPLWHHMALYLAGVIATTATGAVLLVISLRVRTRPTLQLTLLVIASFCLLEGPPYLLWNGVRAVPPGDIGVVHELLLSTHPDFASVFRTGSIVVGAAVTLAASLCLPVLILQCVEALVAPGQRLIGRSRLLVTAIFIAVPFMAGWWIFDWNQLAPGIGVLPSVTGSSVALLAALVAFRLRLPPLSTPSQLQPTGTAIVIAWAAAGALISAVVLM